MFCVETFLHNIISKGSEPIFKFAIPQDLYIFLSGYSNTCAPKLAPINSLQSSFSKVFIWQICIHIIFVQICIGIAICFICFYLFTVKSAFQQQQEWCPKLPTSTPLKVLCLKYLYLKLISLRYLYLHLYLYLYLFAAGAVRPSWPPSTRSIQTNLPLHFSRAAQTRILSETHLYFSPFAFSLNSQP